MARGEQTDGGASAYDAKQRRAKQREDAAAAPAPWPDGCRGCDFTGRRLVVEHKPGNYGPEVVEHPAACGCALGRALTERQGLRPFFGIESEIKGRFHIAIVDPSPAQRVPGGAAAKPYPKIGEYVPKNPIGSHRRQLAQKAMTREEALEWLGMPPEATYVRGVGWTLPDGSIWRDGGWKPPAGAEGEAPPETVQTVTEGPPAPAAPRASGSFRPAFEGHTLPAPGAASDVPEVPPWERAPGGDPGRPWGDEPPPWEDAPLPESPPWGDDEDRPPWADEESQPWNR